MSQDILIERLFEALIEGDRNASRSIVTESLEKGASAELVVGNLFWPVYERISKLHRADQLSAIGHHLSTRLLRVLVDQTALKLEQKPSRNRSVFAMCGPTDADELAAQMAVDLLEADGYRMQFAGARIANDEILSRVQTSRPDVLLLFASAPTDLPNIRSLIDSINEIGAARDVQLVVGGGVFNRADGLAEEIGADLWASTPVELLEVMQEEPDRRATADQRTVGRHKRRRVA